MSCAAQRNVRVTVDVGSDPGRSTDASRPVLIEVMLLGSSIARLASVGSGDREIDYYARLAKNYTVVLFEYEARTQQLQVPPNVVRYPVRFQNRWLHSIFGAIEFAVRTSRPRLIRTKQLWGAWSGVLIKWITGRPLVIRVGYSWSLNFSLERSISSSSIRWVLRAFENWLLHRADGILYGSERLRQHYSAVRVRSLVLPNAVNADRFYPDDSEKLFDVAYVGRLIRLKRFKQVVETVPDDLRLLVVGQGPEAACLADRPNITWYARVPNSELPSLLRSARTYVSFSSTEGSPKALLEAIFCGCYPVVSRIPAHEELIDNLGYGTVCEQPPAPEELRRIIARAEVHPGRLASFRAEYSMDALVKRELDFLHAAAARV